MKCPQCGTTVPLEASAILRQMVAICRPPQSTRLYSLLCPGCRRVRLEVRASDLTNGQELDATQEAC